MWLRYAAPPIAIVGLLLALTGGKNALVAAREDAGYGLHYVDCAAGVKRGCARMDWVCMRGGCPPLPMP
jgi:hypothetical protein